MELKDSLGYIKYEGSSVREGLMDARKQAEALLGLDAALRHFVSKQAPDLESLDYEIPVRVQEGSWEALIPNGVGEWVQAGAGIAATAYVAKAAQKMAENDFGKVGFGTLFKNAMSAIQWFIKLSLHLGDATIRSFKDVKFSENNQLVGIRNNAGEYLYVPKDMLDLYVTANPKLLERIVGNVNADRTLKVGLVSDGSADEVVIVDSQKEIFCPPESNDSDDVLFPELVHGETVTLVGEVTRENKTSNSMGFLYKGHILSAYPESGSIVSYKSLIFAKCRLFGAVNRLDDKNRICARKPKLFFTHLEPVESDESLDLFS